MRLGEFAGSLDADRVSLIWLNPGEKPVSVVFFFFLVFDLHANVKRTLARTLAPELYSDLLADVDVRGHVRQKNVVCVCVCVGLARVNPIAVCVLIVRNKSRTLLAQSPHKSLAELSNLYRTNKRIHTLALKVAGSYAGANCAIVHL